MVAISSKVPDITYFHVAVVVVDGICRARFLSKFATNVVSANDVTYIQGLRMTQHVFKLGGILQQTDVL